MIDVNWFWGNIRAKSSTHLCRTLIIAFCGISTYTLTVAQQSFSTKYNYTQLSPRFYFNESNTHYSTEKYKVTSIPKGTEAGKALRVTGYVSLGLCAALVVTGVTLATKPVDLYTPGVGILSAGACMGGISIPLLVIGKRKSVTNFKP
jgi:hypothetical protein